MPLSKAQVKLLNACEIGEDLQEFLSRELGADGKPKSKDGSDFLIILCNLLQINDHRMEVMRRKLARMTTVEGLQGLIAEPPPEIATVENEIKDCWTRGVALWRTTDHVVRYGEDFGVEVNIKHIEYALMRNNLPVVEMIRFSRPQYFELKPFSSFIYYIVWAIGGILGAIVGVYGGFRGGIHQVVRLPHKMRSYAVPFYALAGMFSGSAMGFMTGALMGLRTGNISAACRLALDASYLNPFHDPRGTRYQQAVELRREEILFELARSYQDKKEIMSSLSF